jgi:hypothetical protein
MLFQIQNIDSTMIAAAQDSVAAEKQYKNLLIFSLWLSMVGG